MRSVVLADPIDLDGWRAQARGLLADGVAPDRVAWSVAGGSVDLFSRAPAAPAVSGGPAFSVPKAFLDLADRLIRHRDETRFALLYRLLWRQAMGEKSLLALRTDPEVARAAAMVKEVGSDAYHMKGYLRFAEIEGDDQAHYVGWFEPTHYVTELAAPHFTKRFATLRWSIFTPDRSAHWDGESLRFEAGAAKAEVPTADALADYWKTYYASIFNPARLKVGAMMRQMPKKYWGNLSEAALIPDLVHNAPRRAEAMVAAEPTLPSRKGRVQVVRPAQPLAGEAADSIDALRDQALRCRACPLWEKATQVVFGEGPPDSALMLVGEQPGDQEDLAGRAFIGPAGQLFDRALAEAGIDRSRAYVTGAVKHFKFEPRGKKRIHQTPNARDIEACNGWLRREIDLVKPKLIVAMGNTALKAVLGRELPVGKLRGRLIEEGGLRVLPTFHPAYLLRMPDPTRAARDHALFVQDLAMAAKMLCA